MHVVVGGADAGVAKPDRDGGGVDIGLQCHRAGVSQHVRMDGPTGQAWAARCGGLCVGREPESDGVPAEASRVRVGRSGSLATPPPAASPVCNALVESSKGAIRCLRPLPWQPMLGLSLRAIAPRVTTPNAFEVRDPRSNGHVGGLADPTGPGRPRVVNPPALHCAHTAIELPDLPR